MARSNPISSALDSTSWAFYAVVASVVALALFLNFLFGGKKQNLPPGPTPLPVIGNLNLVGTNPQQSFYELSKEYGPIMQLQFGNQPVVVGSSVEVARELLRTQDDTFASRPATAASKYINYKDMAYAPYGAFWLQARKLCLDFFSAQRIQSWKDIRAEEVAALVGLLKASAGKKVNTKELLKTFSIKTIDRVILGKDYLVPGASSIISPEEFRAMFDEFYDLNGVVNVGDVLPWIDWLDIQGYVKRMKAVDKKMVAFFEKVIDEKLAEKKNNPSYVAKDVVGALVDHIDDPKLEIPLTRENVKGIALDFIAGSSDSSAATIEWTFSLLLKNPGLIEKAQEELDRVVGKDRWVTEADIPNLPYVYAIIKEGMRLYPAAPLLIPHLSWRDAQVAGYDVPSGTQVFVNIYAMGRDAKLWDNPLEFRPERFLGKDTDILGHHLELMPYGTGSRICPGYVLGTKILQLGMANLLHGFSWRLPDGVTPDNLSMEELFGLSNVKKVPLEVVVEPRLAAELYTS